MIIYELRTNPYSIFSFIVLLFDEELVILSEEELLNFC